MRLNHAGAGRAHVNAIEHVVGHRKLFTIVGILAALLRKGFRILLLPLLVDLANLQASFVDPGQVQGNLGLCGRDFSLNSRLFAFRAEELVLGVEALVGEDRNSSDLKGVAVVLRLRNF